MAQIIYTNIFVLQTQSTFSVWDVSALSLPFSLAFHSLPSTSPLSHFLPFLLSTNLILILTFYFLFCLYIQRHVFFAFTNVLYKSNIVIKFKTELYIKECKLQDRTKLPLFLMTVFRNRTNTSLRKYHLYHKISTLKNKPNFYDFVKKR